MSIFHIEISTSSEFPTVDVQHLLFQLTELLDSKFGNARRENIEFPIELFVEGVTGTLYLRTREAESPPDDPSSKDATTPDDMDQFLDDLSRRLNEDDDPKQP